MSQLDTPSQDDFRQLQARLAAVWEAIESQQAVGHTSVVVPSLSFDQEEMTKIVGAPFYEERLLFSLIRLRHPRARLVYVTSQPIHPDIIAYYLQHLVGVPARHAESRLTMLCAYDAGPRSLTEKILARPRLVERIREAVGDPRNAYLTCFNVTENERRLALALGIPLNGCDPDLLWLGTKSGSRKVFAEAGVRHPRGRGDLSSKTDVIDALAALAGERPGLRRAVVKLNESFSGTGNAIFQYPELLPRRSGERRKAISRVFDANLAYNAAEETLGAYLRKMSAMGGIVEEMVEAQEVRSPSVQMRINPDGTVAVLSSHDQVLGGAGGQTYLGCRFPADEAYRAQIVDDARAIGAVLARHGVISRFGIDFLVTRDGPDLPWESWAIEINLRMGGTTPPFLALQFLTGGEVDEAGVFRSPSGKAKHYYATDNLVSPAYQGLLPEDFVDILTLHGLHFRPSTETGVLFHMIGALSQYGKVGVTCIGDSRAEADELYDRTVAILDRETGPDANLTPPHVLEAGPMTRME